MAFYFSKYFWLIFNPFNLFIFIIFFALIINFFSKGFLNKILFFLIFVSFIITGVMPTGKYLIYTLEKEFHDKIILPDKIDGILILSGASNPELTEEFNQINLSGSVERLTESIQLINQYPLAKIIFSGGSGTLKKFSLTQGEVVKMLFNNFDIDTSKIIFELNARNTYENILLSKKIANPMPSENWLLVTSAFHMSRAMNVAETLEWTFIPFAVDFKVSKNFFWLPSLNFFENMNTFQFSSHEWIGLLAYYLMGRSNKIIY